MRGFSWVGGVSVELVLVTSQVPHYKHAYAPYLSSCPCFGEASPLLSRYLRVLGYCHSAEILQNTRLWWMSQQPRLVCFRQSRPA